MPCLSLHHAMYSQATRQEALVLSRVFTHCFPTRSEHPFHLKRACMERVFLSAAVLHEVAEGASEGATCRLHAFVVSFVAYARVMAAGVVVRVVVRVVVGVYAGVTLTSAPGSCGRD